MSTTELNREYFSWLKALLCSSVHLLGLYSLKCVVCFALVLPDAVAVSEKRSFLNSESVLYDLLVRNYLTEGLINDGLPMSSIFRSTSVIVVMAHTFKGFVTTSFSPMIWPRN